MQARFAFRPATLFPLLFASTLIIGCAEDGLVSPDPHAETEATVVNARTADAEVSGIELETVEVFGQGRNGAVVAGAEATLRRSTQGISATVSMPTPTPGAYDYPEDADVGPPEVFTLWMFVFNDPEADDWDGAFWAAGHAVDGSELTLSGHVSRETDPFVGESLKTPVTAKVHLAVAPHGAVNPDKLPAQLQTPAGTPAHWWFALFE